MGELCQNPRISPVIIWTTSRGNFLQDFEKYAAKSAGRMRTSLYRGIRWRPGENGLRIFEIPERALGVWLGTFNTAEEAAKAYDAGAKIIRVIRDDEAPLNERYAKYIGMKRKFSFLARGVARKMIKVANGSGVVFQRGAKGNGMKSIEFALSMCDTVGIYGFTVDPSYKELPRYFSRPCKGHNPFQICRDKPIISLRSLESIHRIRERKKIDTRF